MAKQAKTDRRAVVDQMRGKQKNAERRRGFAIVGVCAVVALLIIGAAAFKPVMDWWDLRQFEKLELASIGAPASACQDITTKPADGNQDHVPVGTEMPPYPDAPPAFGQHWETWDGMERKFYTPSDRPDLGLIVHNLEHGYTILWYDETAADDDEMMDQVRAISQKYKGTSNLRLKFKAVPWTEDDGAAFPKGQHIAFTHWSKGVADGGEEAKQLGVFQYCSAPSGPAIQEFMDAYPYLDSPEPNAV